MAPGNYTDADHTKSNAITHWVMAAVMAAGFAFVAAQLSWPWVFDFDSPEFNPVILLLGLLGVACAVSLFNAARWTLRQHRFGTATMVLGGGGRVLMGGRFEGEVRTARPLRPEGDYRLVLSCVETHQFNDQPRMGYRTTSSESFTVWRQELTVPAAGVESQRGIPFAFRLPDSVGPEREPEKDSFGQPYFKLRAAIRIPGMRRAFGYNVPPGARTWQLDVTAPMPGTDFHAQFVVPVQRR